MDDQGQNKTLEVPSRRLGVTSRTPKFHQGNDSGPKLQPVGVLAVFDITLHGRVGGGSGVTQPAGVWRFELEGWMMAWGRLGRWVF